MLAHSMSETSPPNLRSKQTQSSDTSQSLLRQVKRNDAAAWQRLVDLYTPLVCYWCRRASLSQEDTEEITQEAFRSVHAGIANFRHEQPGDTFRGWLRTIVRSKIANLCQQRKHATRAAGGSEAQHRLEQLPEAIDEDETSAVNSLFERAMRLIEDKFAPKTWRAFLLVVVEEQSTMEAGRRLGMTPAAVRNARWKVLRELRMQLGDLE